MDLFNHQQEALEFAIKNDGKCALFHDCGLGKTRTTLEVYGHFKAEETALKMLVVCPISLIHSAWGADIAKFTTFSAAPLRDLKTSRQPVKLPDIIIVNYESLISKKIFPIIRDLIARHPFMGVLDESSRLKSNKSLTTKALLTLAPMFKHRVILSGTPMPNSELELWGQVRFVRPEAFDKSFYKFRNTYFHLERNGEAMAPIQGKVMNRMMMRNIMMQGWKYTITPFMREHIFHKIKPFTHWMKKDDALDLPEQIEQIREVSLSGPESEAYRDMKNYLVTEIGGQTIAAQVALAKIMKLRQVTSGFIYDAQSTAQVIGKTKLNELENVLEQLGEQPAVIFVEFHYEIEAISALIAKKYGADQVATLYSGTENKEKSISDFQQGRVRYLIAHPRSAAHGLTFVNCSTMIFFSLDYSYEAHEQARNRIHRIGQKNKCLYIYLIAKNTIDEVLLGVLGKKQSLQDAVQLIVKGAKIIESRNEDQSRRAALPQKRIPESVGVQAARL
jgi:SNF2 family DNA or RNA helicase